MRVSDSLLTPLTPLTPLLLSIVWTMPEIFSREWDTDVYKGKTSFSTGLFINGQFVDGRKGTTIEWAVLVVIQSYSILIYILSL